MVAMTSVIGRVENITQKIEFDWKIEDFFALPAEDEKVYRSPMFSFAGESWNLQIYPNGCSKHNSLGRVALYLRRNESGPPINLIASLGLRKFDGKKDREEQFTHVFEEAAGYGFTSLFRRDTLFEEKVQLVPSDILTVVCSVEHFLETIYDTNKTVKCSHCKESFIPSDEKKCPDKSVTCPKCTDVEEPRKCFDHECGKTRETATEKLLNDFESLLGNDEHSDVTIKVKDEEFHLHKCILAGRNPYFNSMFKTEMKEKATGIVNSDDCEPDIFRSFIHFVYTGKVDDLSLENVCDLYKVADKYQEDQLKEECLCFMNNKMSVETFCDFIILALKYDEKKLLQNATDLFCKKIKEIIQTVEWQTFMREYPTEANELHIKAVDYYIK